MLSLIEFIPSATYPWPWIFARTQNSNAFEFALKAVEMGHRGNVGRRRGVGYCGPKGRCIRVDGVRLARLGWGGLAFDGDTVEISEESHGRTVMDYATAKKGSQSASGWSLL